MYASDNVRAKFRINKSLISDVIDMFGMDIRFYDEKEETVCVSANVNEQAMVQYARNYVPDIVVLEPAELKGKVKEALYRGIAAYEE
jgi:predicted DNA-binding transcriptional regulator YafY